jgi:hypothetical protein
MWEVDMLPVYMAPCIELFTLRECDPTFRRLDLAHRSRISAFSRSWNRHCTASNLRKFWYGYATADAPQIQKAQASLDWRALWSQQREHGGSRSDACTGTCYGISASDYFQRFSENQALPTSGFIVHFHKCLLTGKQIQEKGARGSREHSPYC